MVTGRATSNHAAALAEQQTTSTRSVDALKRRLAEAQRHLNAERKRRDLLCLKLTVAGCSTREIGAIAGLSSPGVLLATDRAQAELENRDA